MVTVTVFRRSSGKPAHGEKVAISFDVIGRGITDGVRTDSDGDAYFDVEPGDGKVFVNGSTEYKGRISGNIVVHI